jgi:hypothetical protein
MRRGCGRLLHLEPSHTVGLTVDVLAYAIANEAFPHEPTSD